MKGGDFVAKQKKKKRRKNPRRKSSPPVSRVRDKHHLCYQRKKWGRGALASFRDYWYCRMYIPRDTLHKMIHLEVPNVPPPSESSARAALEQLGYLEQYGSITEFDSLERRLDLLAALFDCSDQPTADAFRAQLEVVRKFKKAPQ